MDRRDAYIHVSFPEMDSRPAAPEPLAPFQRGSFAQRQSPNWPAIFGIVLCHVAVLGLLIKFDVVALPKPQKGPIVVQLIAEPPAPPPATPEPQPQEVKVKTPPIVAPPPIISIPAMLPPVMSSPEAPPPKAMVVSSPAKAAPVSGPVAISDLSSRMTYAPSPRFSVESRRKREGGVVHVRVLLGLDGSVSEAALVGTSGFARVDKAVLEAVRKWRWSPIMRNGAPVMVSGIVDVTVNPPA